VNKPLVPIDAATVGGLTSTKPISPTANSEPPAANAKTRGEAVPRPGIQARAAMIAPALSTAAITATVSQPLLVPERQVTENLGRFG
jgi:hypothetical protein